MSQEGAGPGRLELAVLRAEAPSAAPLLLEGSCSVWSILSRLLLL